MLRGPGVYILQYMYRPIHLLKYVNVFFLQPLIGGNRPTHIWKYFYSSTFTCWVSLALLYLPEPEMTCTFADILGFVTGSQSIPVMGFEISPSILFNHPADLTATRQHLAGHFMANTCSMQFMLPLLSGYDLFRDRFLSTLQVQTFFTNN